MVVNHEEFDKQKIKYEKFWNASIILKDIRRLNPDFYPKPIKELNISGIPNFENIKKEFLTEKDFLIYYDKCGKVLHGSNPFGSQLDYKY